MILLNECFNSTGNDRLARLSIEVSEELLLPFVHELVQVFIVSLLGVLDFLGLNSWLLDLVFNWIQEERVFPGFDLRGCDESLTFI